MLGPDHIFQIDIIIDFCNIRQEIGDYYPDPDPDRYYYYPAISQSLVCKLIVRRARRKHSVFSTPPYTTLGGGIKIDMTWDITGTN